jgi:hypothetical protein
MIKNFPDYLKVPTCLAAVCLSVLLAALSGCGDSGPTVVKVAGVATRDGKPVPNVELTFLPEVGRPSWSFTDDAGRFSLNYTRDQDGAVLGKHKVTVRAKPPASPAEEFSGKSSAPPYIQELITKYGSAESTPLEVEISGAVENLEIKLD